MKRVDTSLIKLYLVRLIHIDTINCIYLSDKNSINVSEKVNTTIIKLNMYIKKD